MMKMSLAVAGFLFIGGFGWVSAADKKAGTSGAPFLKIGAGARTTAMGDAVVGFIDDVNAVYFNPAGLACISRPELTGMQMQWFQGMNYQFGGFAYPTDYGAFALSASTLKVDEIQRRATDESLQGSFEAMDAAYGVSYARNIGPLFSLGLTTRYIKQEIDSYSAGTWSADVGFMKRVAGRSLSYGLAIRHFGQSVEFRNTSDPLPLTFDFGAGAMVFKEKLRLATNVKMSRDRGWDFGVGTEYRRPLKGDLNFALRGGYNSSMTDAEDAKGLTVGAGLGYRRLVFDFAWVPLGELGNTFRYAVHFKF